MIKACIAADKNSVPTWKLFQFRWPESYSYRDLNAGIDKIIRILPFSIKVAMS